MAARNGPEDFGWVSRTIHWLMAFAIVAMLPFGFFIANMQPSMSNLWMYGAHKSAGIVLLVLFILRVIWHRVSPPPPILTAGAAAWQLTTARLVHVSMYLAMFAMPLSGWIASSASGPDVVIFGRWPLPRTAPVSEAWEAAFFALHGWIAMILIGLIALHVSGAILRHRHGDRTLFRMFGR